MNLLHTFKLHSSYSHGTIVHQWNEAPWWWIVIFAVIIANSMVFSVGYFLSTYSTFTRVLVICGSCWSWLRQPYYLFHCTHHHIRDSNIGILVSVRNKWLFEKNIKFLVYLLATLIIGALVTNTMPNINKILSAWSHFRLNH